MELYETDRGNPDKDQTCLHLKYRSLDVFGDHIESLERNEGNQKILETIGELQTEILNVINIH